MSKTPFDKFEERAIAKKGHWRNSFDSRYLRVFWLNGKPRIVTITAVQELISSNKRESKQQLLVSLAEAEKKWAINVTNSATIEMITGKGDPQDWVGYKIELYVTKTRDPSGAIVDCIRVREELPPQTGAAQPEKPKHRQEVYQYLTAMKDATTEDALVPISDAIIDDNSLSPEETSMLTAALGKRTKQITGEK